MSPRAAILRGDRESRPQAHRDVVECPVCGFISNSPRLMVHHVKACAMPRRRS